MDDDDKYRYCPPWANAEIINDNTWVGLDADCPSWNSLVEWRTKNEATDGD